MDAGIGEISNGLEPLRMAGSAGPDPRPAAAREAHPPATKVRVEELGLNRNNLIRLILKTLYTRGCETAKDLSDSTRLHIAVLKEILEELKQHAVLEILGSVDLGDYQDFRYALTGKGREWAIDALGQSQYVGPAPVPLDEYYAQVHRQSVTGLTVDRSALTEMFSHLVVPGGLAARLGPAVNSARSILFYGAPGNGKTAIAEAISRAFGGCVYIPFAIEVEGEIIKIFDPIYHRRLKGLPETDGTLGGDRRRPEFTDRRWVICSRPVITVGGELTLEMLDLHYNPVARFYDAPLHMKSNGGIFIIDDLGRQLVNPKDLLNRWIVPMEKNVDFLSLQNGATFSLPFDNLLIFSTNLSPSDLMDPAFLRRIPYKIEMTYPTEQQFREAFGRLCGEYGMEPCERMISFAIHELQATHEQPLCFYQPKFILDQVVAAAKFEGIDASLTEELVAQAIGNISAKTSNGAG